MRVACNEEECGLKRLSLYGPTSGGEIMERQMERQTLHVSGERHV